MKTLRDICLDIFAESDQSGDDPFLLKNVKLCGLLSVNGRSYPDAVLAEAVQAGRYSNIPLCIQSENHKDGVAEPGKHGYADRLGCIINPAARAGSGVFADARLNPKHPLAEAVSWDYRNRTKGVGLSQTGFFQLDATGKTILAVHEIKSIDVVLNPATTVSLVESEQEPEVDEVGEHITKMLAHPKFLEYMNAFGQNVSPALVESAQFKAALGTALAEITNAAKEPARPVAIRPGGVLPEPYTPRTWSPPAGSPVQFKR